MSDILLRQVKGSPLTNNQVDANFTNLNNDKFDDGGPLTATTIITTDLSSLDGGINVNDDLTVDVSGNIITSGTLTSGATTITGELSLSTATISGAGIIPSTANPIVSTYSIVTSGVLNSGVILPTSELGLIIKVVNATAVTIKLYPATSGTINGGTVNTAISIPSGSSSQLVGVSATDWKTLVETVIYDESSVRLN